METRASTSLTSVNIKICCITDLHPRVFAWRPDDPAHSSGHVGFFTCWGSGQLCGRAGEATANKTSSKSNDWGHAELWSSWSWSFFQLIFSKVWDNLQDDNVYQNNKLLIHSSTAEIKLIYEHMDFFQDWQQRVRLFGGKTFFLSWQLSRNVRSRWLIAVYFKSGWKTYKMNLVKNVFWKAVGSSH